MHGEAKSSDQFLSAVIKVCKILLRFFLAGFQYCLFKLELGWCSPFLLILPKLVIPSHKSPGPVACIQHGLAAPWQPTPSFDSLIWLSPKVTESTCFLFFLFASLSYPNMHVHTRAHLHTHPCTHAHTLIIQQVSEGIPPVKFGHWACYSKRDRGLSFPVSLPDDLNASNMPYHSPTVPSDLPLAILNLFHFLKHPALS